MGAIESGQTIITTINGLVHVAAAFDEKLRPHAKNIDPNRSSLRSFA